MTGAVSTSELLVDVYQTARRSIPEESIFKICKRYHMFAAVKHVAQEQHTKASVTVKAWKHLEFLFRTRKLIVSGIE
jgi:hypothetical protein